MDGLIIEDEIIPASDLESKLLYFFDIHINKGGCISYLGIGKTLFGQLQ